MRALLGVNVLIVLDAGHASTRGAQSRPPGYFRSAYLTECDPGRHAGATGCAVLRDCMRLSNKMLSHEVWILYTSRFKLSASRTG